MEVRQSKRKRKDGQGEWREKRRGEGKTEKGKRRVDGKREREQRMYQTYPRIRAQLKKVLRTGIQTDKYVFHFHSTVQKESETEQSAARLQPFSLSTNSQPVKY